MASPLDRRQRLKGAVYKTFGEAADWISAIGGDPISVRVIEASEDEVLRFGDSRLIVGTIIYQVRGPDGFEPQEADRAQILPSGPLLRVIGEPMRARHGLDWICQMAGT
jgi:hypothetical protein